MHDSARKQLHSNWFIGAFIAVGVVGTLFVSSILQATTRLLSRAAQTSAVLQMIPSQQTTSPGATNTIDVMLSPNGVGIKGVELVLDYDPAFLDIIDVTAGSLFTKHTPTAGQPVTLIKNIAQPGRIHYAIAFGLTDPNFSSQEVGIVASIQYRAKANGTSQMSFVTTGSTKTLVAAAGQTGSVLGNANGTTITIGAVTQPTVRTTVRPTRRPGTEGGESTGTRPTRRPGTTGEEGGRRGDGEGGTNPRPTRRPGTSGEESGNRGDGEGTGNIRPTRSAAGSEEGGSFGDGE